MRALLARFIITFIAVLLVAYGIPRLFNLSPPIRIGPLDTPDWTTILLFSALLALVNTFIRPILKVIALPITCLTAGIFSFVINLLMFFLAAWLTNQLRGGENVQVDWLGALIGAIAIAVVGLIINVPLPKRWEA
jgi:putative membrane protein